MYGQERPSLPSATAARVSVNLDNEHCGHPDVHAGHMFQSHVLVQLLPLPLPWALNCSVQPDCVTCAAADADSGELAPLRGCNKNLRDPAGRMT